MCIQESRWHAICNHTILARTECPDKCAQYDTIETQMPAYCHACRKQVDAQGVTARYQNQQQGRPSRRPGGNNPSAPPAEAAGPALAGSQSSDGLRGRALKAASPAPTGRLPDPPAGGARRLGASASTSDLRRALSERGRKASLDRLASGHDARERGREQPPPLPRPKTANDASPPPWSSSDGRPEMLSPVPKKPLLSLRIPEEAVFPLPADSRTPSSLSSSSRPTTRNGGADARTIASPVDKTPITPRTPTSSVSEDPPSSNNNSCSNNNKKPRASTPPDSQGAVEDPAPPRVWFRDLRRSFGLRRAKSSGRVAQTTLSSKPKLVDAASPRKAGFDAGTNGNGHGNSPTSAVSETAAALPGPAGSQPSEFPRLRMTRSSRTLFDGSEHAKAKMAQVSSALEARKVSAASPLVVTRKTSGAVNHFPPATKRKLIDIHDPECLARHGLKWDTRGWA